MALGLTADCAQFARSDSLSRTGGCLPMNKNFCINLVAGALVAFSAIAAAPSAQRAPQAGQAEINLSGTHGFDFLVGEWRVHHRRISAVSKKWVEFDGTCSLRL